MTEKTENLKVSKIKIIPLCDPMGGDSSCCIHSKLCKQIIELCGDPDIDFRCPLLMKVDESVKFSKQYISCFDAMRME